MVGYLEESGGRENAVHQLLVVLPLFEGLSVSSPLALLRPASCSNALYVLRLLNIRQLSSLIELR